MFKPQRANVITTIVSLVFTLTLLGACSKPSEISEEKSTYHQSADIQTISPSEFYEVSREYIGKVVSKQLASLSFEYGGKVENVYVDSGDLVTKDQLLAEFNTDLIAIKIKEIDASIRQLNAQAELNRLNLARINELSTKGYSSKQTLDELETEKEVIKADLSRQQANKSTLNYQISKAQLHAPFAGVISSRSVAEGEIFGSNQTAFELIKQTQHEISVGVPVKVARTLTTGQALQVELGEQEVTATVLVIGKQVNSISRTVEVRLAVSAKAVFYNGQIAKVKILQRVNQAGFWLPLAALTDGIRGQWNIFRVDNAKDKLFTIAATTVEVKYSTLDAAYITGLTLTDHNIIVAGVHRYVPGQIVKKSSASNAKTTQVGNAL